MRAIKGIMMSVEHDFKTLLSTGDKFDLKKPKYNKESEETKRVKVESECAYNEFVEYFNNTPDYKFDSRIGVLVAHAY